MDLKFSRVLGYVIVAWYSSRTCRVVVLILSVAIAIITVIKFR